MQAIRLIDCDPSHLPAIREIFNEVIEHSTALYDYHPRSYEQVEQWMQAKQLGNFPIIGAVDGDQRLLGFASYGVFRNFPAYLHTVEISLYVDARCRGQGIGGKLLEELVHRATEQKYHVLIAAIDAENVASQRLHLRHGFEPAGTLREVGFKFDRWLNLELYQRVLNE